MEYIILVGIVILLVLVLVLLLRKPKTELTVPDNKEDLIRLQRDLERLSASLPEEFARSRQDAATGRAAMREDIDRALGQINARLEKAEKGNIEHELQLNRLLNNSLSELRDRKVTLIAEEMRALSRITGAYCPVWVVITKCDQIEGFSEFFSLLSDEDCEKPLGWSNPRPDGPYDAAATDLAFNRLVDHLRTLRGSLALHPSIWEKTASGEKRADLAAPIWLLPDKVEALRENLKRYLAGIFTHVRHKKQDRGIFRHAVFRNFPKTDPLHVDRDVGEMTEERIPPGAP